MSYIIMGRDECNVEDRPNYPEFATEQEAYDKLDEARENYPEYRSLWVEELHDKAYYLDKYDQDDYDYYD